VEKIKAGIIGCGVIGSEIASACVTVLSKKIELVALYDIDKQKSAGLSKLIKKDVAVDAPDELYDKSDFVIEAATGGVARETVKKVIEKRKSVLVMSVGGLIESQDLIEEAKKKNIKLFFPSGAICGIDGLKSAGVSKIESVTLTTKKPPRGLAGAPYLKEKNIDVNSIKSETVVFSGSALEAVAGFPKNVNVSSILSLTGIGAKKTKVKIVTSPEFKKNAHEIEIIGDFGRMTTRTENVPSEKNPKTSKLAALSAIATLTAAVESVRFGT